MSVLRGSYPHPKRPHPSSPERHIYRAASPSYRHAVRYLTDDSGLSFYDEKNVIVENIDDWSISSEFADLTKEVNGWLDVAGNFAYELRSKKFSNLLKYFKTHHDCHSEEFARIITKLISLFDPKALRLWMVYLREKMGLSGAGKDFFFALLSITLSFLLEEEEKIDVPDHPYPKLWTPIRICPQLQPNAPSFQT